jgi:hypothetical protein
VKYCRSRQLLLAILALILDYQGRALQNNESPVLNTRRDSKALEMLQSTVQALSPAEGTTISDYHIEGVVTQWDGLNTPGTFSQTGVGTADRHTVVSVDGSQVFNFLVVHDAGTLQLGTNNSPRLVPNEVAMEASYYFYVTLLQEALSSELVEVVLLPSPSSASTVARIRITRRIAGWVPLMGSLGAAQFEISIDRTSNTVTQIVNQARLERNLGHTIPHAISFSDYSREEGWFLPHTIDETFAGAPNSHIVLHSYSLNRGLAVPDLTSR